MAQTKKVRECLDREKKKRKNMKHNWFHLKKKGLIELDVMAFIYYRITWVS